MSTATIKMDMFNKNTILFVNVERWRDWEWPVGTESRWSAVRRPGRSSVTADSFTSVFSCGFFLPLLTNQSVFGLLRNQTVACCCRAVAAHAQIVCEHQILVCHSDWNAEPCPVFTLSPSALFDEVLSSCCLQQSCQSRRCDCSGVICKHTASEIAEA